MTLTGWRAASLFMALAVSAPAFADAPPQAHASCSDESDKKCVRAWFAEYRSGLADEFRYWSAFRPDAVSGSQAAASRDVEQAIVDQAYRHNTWSFVRAPEEHGISPSAWDAVWACRTAIIDMKFWLIGIQHDDYDQGESDRVEYDKAARECRPALRP